LNAKQKEQEAFAAGVAYAQINQFLGAYAARVGISFESLAKRVGKVLSHSQGGELLGADSRMSYLPRKASKAREVWRAKMEVVDKPLRKHPLKGRPWSAARWAKFNEKRKGAQAA
jgi:hypothetical protein